MKKWEIYNTALHVLGRSCTEADLDFDPPAAEIDCCNVCWPQARMRALREHNWSFFIERLSIDMSSEADIPGHGYLHGFRLPDGLLALAPARNSSRFDVYGNVYYCNRKPADGLYGIMDDCMDDMDHPEDFDHLVAYALAYLVAPILAPGDQKAADLAASGYSWVRENLMRLESNNNRKIFLYGSDGYDDMDDEEERHVRDLYRRFHG